MSSLGIVYIARYLSVCPPPVQQSSAFRNSVERFNGYHSTLSTNTQVLEYVNSSALRAVASTECYTDF